jgi:hypothetical protein
MMSAILAFLSAEAAAVALLRIVRISQGMPIPDMQVSAASPRSLLLWAFAAYMIGCTARELVVLTFGLTGWPDTAIILSAASRGVQIGGACLFVYALTARFCGHYIWISSLAMAVVFGAIVTAT